MTLSALAVALMITLGKSLSHELPPQVIVFAQSFVAFMLMLPYFMLSKKNELMGATSLGLSLFRAILDVLANCFYFFALAFIPILNVIILQNVSTLLIPLVAFLWLRERLTLWMWCTLILGFVGVWLVVQPTTHGVNLGSIFALLAALLSSWAIVGIKRLSDQQTSRQYLFYSLGFMSLLTLPTFVLFLPSLELWMVPYLIGIGVAMGVMEASIIHAYQYASASQLAPFFYLEILFGALIDWWFFHILPTAVSLVGMILIILAGLLIIPASKRLSSK